jgi:hypothetical protein
MRIIFTTTEQVEFVLGRVASAPKHRTRQMGSVWEERMLAFAVGCNGCRDTAEVAAERAEDDGVAAVAGRSQGRDVLQELAKGGQKQLMFAVIMEQPFILWRPLRPAQGITHLLEEWAVDNSR